MPGETVITKEQAIVRLSAEVRAARELIKTQTAQIKALTDQLTTETAQSNSLLRSYESAKSEIEALRTANEALGRAIELNEKSIALLSGEIQKERKSKGKWKRRALLAVAAVAGIILVNR